jgi:SAM-dependent methyltransferase
MKSQATIDAENSNFWDEMCGSTSATRIGATGNDMASLRRFDDWFFGFYPYLDKFINFESMRGKSVLEVGLGYGSVGQRLAENAAHYTGLDIAQGPVEGMNHRIAQSGLNGLAKRGSILEAPFDDESFHCVVAIGCFHHTGNMQRAIDEAARVLKPGGRAVIMVYNALSYVRWILHTKETASYWARSLAGASEPLKLDEYGRARFDVDRSGRAAPEGAVVTKPVFTRMLARHFKDIRISRTNIGNHKATLFLSRTSTVPLLGPFMGLDLYATAIK